MKAWLSLSPLVAIATLGCAPEAGPPASIVTETRVLAIRAVPAESAPGTNVRYSALVAAPEGTISSPALSWSLCAAPKPLTQNNIVAEACRFEAVMSIGTAQPAARASTPADACKLFGPESPAPGLRPRDPDRTGGYFLPVRVDLDGRQTFGLHRIRCNLAQAPADVALRFRNEYTENLNPDLITLDIPESVPIGAVIDVQAKLTPASAETYVRFDPETQDLVTDTEALTVSWFATGGRFDTDRSVGIETSVNTWTAPTTPGRVEIWAVARDDRGGIDFISQTLEVGP